MSMTDTYAERFDRLEALLGDAIDNDRPFNLDDWIAIDRFEPECGTVCCAMGLAMLDPWFQAQGLRTFAYAYAYDSTEDGGEFAAIPDATVEKLAEAASRNRKLGASLEVSPMFNGHRDFNAAATLFGIAPTAAMFVFSPQSYPSETPATPDDVLAHIRRVRNGQEWGI